VVHISLSLLFCKRPLHHARRRLSNGRIEAELALGVILLLQRLELVLLRGFVSVPALRALGTVRVVDVRVELAASRADAHNLAQLLTQRLDLGVSRGIGRSVNDKRRAENEILAETECRGHVVLCADTACGVVLEHEDGVGVGIVGAGDGGSVDVVGFAHRGGVVGLDVDGEAGVVEAKVLAWRRSQCNTSPGSEVLVGARLGSDDERVQVMERLRVLGVYGSDAFLDDVHDEDRLDIVSTCTNMGILVAIDLPCWHQEWHRSTSTTS
jgi:hypothetical protein